MEVLIVSYQSLTDIINIKHASVADKPKLKKQTFTYISIVNWESKDTILEKHGGLLIAWQHCTHWMNPTEKLALRNNLITNCPHLH